MAHSKMRLHYSKKVGEYSIQDEQNNAFNYVLRATGTILTKNQELLLAASKIFLGCNVCINIKIAYTKSYYYVLLYIHFCLSKSNK